MSIGKIILNTQFAISIHTALLPVALFFAGGLDEWYILCMPASITAVILFILAFRFPSSRFVVTSALVSAAVME